MGQPITTYQDLIAWQKAYLLGKAVYDAATRMSEPDKFGLPSMLKRLAVSVASHIAAGYGRGATGDYLWHLKHARGELYQMDTQLMFSLDFRFIAQSEYEPLKAMLDEAERVLAGLIRSLGG